VSYHNNNAGPTCTFSHTVLHKEADGEVSHLKQILIDVVKNLRCECKVVILELDS
jgi:hypothetical protein